MTTVAKDVKNPLRDLDTFTRVYVEAALWSSTDDNDQPLDRNYSWTDMAEDTLQEIIDDCHALQEASGDDLAGNYRKGGYDFWLTRNGHGAGFWDGDWPEAEGERLTEASKAFGEYNLYVGDDGKIHGCKG